MPPDLSLNSDKSFVYEFSGETVGLLYFTGRVEVSSLIGFFRQNMSRDGWTLVSSVRSSRNLLNFAKPHKTCQIIVQEKTWTTEVEVWVHPYKAVEG
jgi:hypothetical protein